MLRVDRRYELNAKLVDLLSTFLGENCTDRVYFEPPASVKMKYPCIVYSNSSASIKHASDKAYFGMMSYTVTYISKTRDNQDFINAMLETFPYCSYDRPFVNDNLHHESFKVYY